MKTQYQTSIHEERVLGGPAYPRNEAHVERGMAHYECGLGMVSQKKLGNHFAPVATEEVLRNRWRWETPARNQRILPVVRATGPVITQPEIDDAVDNPLRSELEALMLDCDRPGWDGYGAAAVSMDARRAAERFIHNLPVSTPQPELSVDPDGCITFEWRKSPRLTLLVSVRSSYDLDYAALLGTTKAHGSEPFFDGLSETLKTLIQRVLEA